MAVSARTQELGPAGDALGVLLGRKRYVRVGAVDGAATGLVVAWLARRVPAVLVVVPDAKAAEALALDAEAFSGAPARPFRTWPDEPDDATPDPDVLAARVRALEAVREGRGAVLVAPLAAAAQEVPSPEALEAATVSVAPGDERPPSALAEHLALSGFVRVGAAESPGEFSFRGGALDVFPFGADGPIRVDFDGDVVESVRPLDPATRRALAPLPGARFLALEPARLRRPAPSGEGVFVTRHLPEGGVVVVVEPESVAARAAVLRGLDEGPSRARWKRLDRELAAARRVDLSSLRLGPDGDLDLEAHGLEDLRGVASLAEREGGHGGPGGRASPQATVAAAFRRLASRASRVVVHRRAAGEEERLRELLGGEARAGGAPLDLDGVPVEFEAGSLSRSFLLGPTRTAHVAYDDLADLAVRERRAGPGLAPSRPIESFLELEVGEPVVHLHHGIGIFRGLVTRKDPEPSQWLAVEFAEGTTMHVPVARIDLVQRYVGTGRRPRLSRLGGTEWEARKGRVAEAVADLAQRLLAVQAMRRARSGPAMRRHPQWQDEFVRAFPWRDTPDQAAATQAIEADLAGSRPTDRLLCGDVGYGKTEVALRAAFLAAVAGRQVAVLVPTTVLAEQHLRTFSARLSAYPLVVRALSRFRTPSETREILGGLATGGVDVVVGTHRLLSRDVRFHDLGLVVVDEEQRFGVEHKERLKELRADVDVLTLSATPIPRTLHMALLGLRDISNLTTPPPGRLAIDTKVARMDEALVREALRRELDRGGQAFVVHNRVFDLDVVAGTIQRLVPEARLATVHGQMDRDLVEERMLGFVRGDVDVLVTTTIVESGLDIPNANTIVVHNADRFGLAELHQLRGRVGRERRHAHALLLVAKDRRLSEEAAHRLRALEEYSELGAGFRIALRDLELRGAGNLLGPEQSGHIAAVGYDLYCRLLADAVKAVRREAPRTAEPAAVDVELACGVPPEWIDDPRQSFRVLRRVAAAQSVEALDAFAEEVEGRFGPIPAPARRLFLHQAVRLLAAGAGVARVGPAEAGGLVLEASSPHAFDRLRSLGLPLRRIDAGKAYLPPPEAASDGDVPARLAASLERLHAVLRRDR
jgi:transcription-repair coupling factor (superfamily II helicase)